MKPLLSREEFLRAREVHREQLEHHTKQVRMGLGPVAPSSNRADYPSRQAHRRALSVIAKKGIVL
ncbi:MAG: hypothetical protein EPO45_19195 [Sphingobium sp.]|nr:MAG: hypothetical protein EPO45_19195 [Sphingobium sp.]